MIIDGYWLPLMWAVLAAGWAFSALVRLVLVMLSWPEQRMRRTFAVIVHLVVAAFFIWRKTGAADVPDHIPLYELNRNLASLLLVAWALLDGIWGVMGMADRRALNIWRDRQTADEKVPS